MDLLGQLEHPVVRDLAWAVFSEDLILPEALDPGSGNLRPCALSILTPARSRWLQALDHSPGPLLTHVSSRLTQPLGLYFESLWHFFLRSDPAADLLATNLPVRDAGSTVGEFDCLYRCRESGDIVHLELAVKFYLYTGPGTGGNGDNRADWLGPGCRDRLDRKLNRLASHQTRLAWHPAAQRTLKRRGLMPDRTELAVKGRLFRRPDQPMLPPTGFNRRNTLLHWDYLAALPDLIAVPGSPLRHVIVPRRHWLAPLAPSARTADHTTLRRYSDLTTLTATLSQHFAAAGGPQVVVSLDADGRETGRCFVVPPDWPRQRGD